jgi:hypothetical protein
MAADNSTHWLLVSDQNGQPYWKREADGVIATVHLTEMNGELVWRYSAGIDQWSIVGYKDTVRSAKIAASKAWQWYRLRAKDFRRIQTKLRLLWLQQGIESVQPMRGDSWDERVNQVPSYGILWFWDKELSMWISGAWRLWYNRSTGWMLRYPDDYIQELHVDNRYDAMKEAAFWIGLALEE